MLVIIKAPVLLSDQASGLASVLERLNRQAFVSLATEIIRARLPQLPLKGSFSGYFKGYYKHWAGIRASLRVTIKDWVLLGVSLRLTIKIGLFLGLL